ncbi:mechanosensitive ion channel family protein [Candidatus Peregrinibacteria bacterium]|nr:mechanosensitive ion channel family protein [Candidatus Peregrinibacteria bacterium]
MLIKIVIWSVGGLLIFSNLGFDVTSLVTSLGIGGIAVALAVQNILGDIFSSFSLYFDKPFQVGDFIIAGEHSGRVKKIGLKSTRLETLQGEELVISNKELTTSRVQNFKKLKRRRVALNFGLIYETPVKKLRKVNDIVKEIIEGLDVVEFGRSHFSQFAAASLNFEVIYFVNSQEYEVYMDRQQEINLKIKEAFEKEKITMAYPTQTLYLKK